MNELFFEVDAGKKKLLSLSYEISRGEEKRQNFVIHAVTSPQQQQQQQQLEPVARAAAFPLSRGLRPLINSQTLVLFLLRYFSHQIKSVCNSRALPFPPFRVYLHFTFRFLYHRHLSSLIPCSKVRKTFHSFLRIFAASRQNIRALIREKA